MSINFILGATSSVSQNSWRALLLSSISFNDSNLPVNSAFYRTLTAIWIFLSLGKCPSKTINVRRFPCMLISLILELFLLTINCPWSPLVASEIDCREGYVSMISGKTFGFWSLFEARSKLFNFGRVTKASIWCKSVIRFWDKSRALNDPNVMGWWCSWNLEILLQDRLSSLIFAGKT